ncbi:hypothetical protein B0A48_04559 [Cryoendolithus antarcticus]|uniref:Amino acid permease/ SLC12A domain-containing protein n=1 Tax=Cryoendolithus antarcticus TaxID=1507870 RepID=A0A1V8TG67_9PEZI|nr:hypothetical protein B0A48_04559 [Cryoendolithus antarcticus]
MGSRHDPKMAEEDIVEAHPVSHFDDDGKLPASTVADRWRGTAADKRDMAVLGRTQVLRRNFKFTAILGFSSTVLVAWEILPVISVYALQDGGTAIIFWGLIAGIIGMSFVYASLAEMASMFPTAGGQYHWVSELAAPTWQKPLSYFVGWLTAMGWQVYLAGICFMVGSVLQGLIVLNNLDTYVYASWHGTLLTIAVILFASLFNTVLAVRLPLIEGIMLVIHIAGLFAIIIPLWIMAPRGDAYTTLLTFPTTAGWMNQGLAALIGMCNPIGILVGYDCSVHMSEEVQDAGYVLPRALMWTVVPNGIMALLMGLTFIFCLGDIETVLASPTYEPFIQVFYNATQSNAATTIMTLIIALMLTSACISEVATASRQLWSFARDRGVPFSSWLAHVTPGSNIPIRAVYVSIIISSLLSLINIGSYVALNAISSLGVVSLLSSYTVTISCMIWRRRRGAPLPPARWSLGKYGLAINIISLLFVLPVWFFAFWPVGYQPTPEGLNWAPVMFVGVLSLAAIYYVVKARHVYNGPVTIVKRDE